jgi:hypothetical protein
MKTKLLAGLILAGSSLFAGPRIAVGIGFGAPVAPVVVAPPPCPGPGYVFVDGYWRPGFERRDVMIHRDEFRHDDFRHDGRRR